MEEIILALLLNHMCKKKRGGRYGPQTCTPPDIDRSAIITRFFFLKFGLQASIYTVNPIHCNIFNERVTNVFMIRQYSSHAIGTTREFYRRYYTLLFCAPEQIVCMNEFFIYLCRIMIELLG